MFKNVISGVDYGQTELKKEQITLLERTVEYINNNAKYVTLSDKNARIKSINYEFSIRIGNICCERLLEEIKVKKYVAIVKQQPASL
jgi:hypothetical protein